MPELSGFPYAEVQFDREGSVNPPGQEDDVLAVIRAAAPSDLVVIAHGWNNDMEDARNLYAAIFAHAAAIRAGALAADRRVAVLGLLWPSKKFTERELIAGGGAASLGHGTDAGADVSVELLEREIDVLKAAASPHGPDLDEAKSLLDRLENDPQARRRFLELVRESLDPSESATETGSEVTPNGLEGDAEDVFRELQQPIFDAPADSGLGGAAGLGDADIGGAAGIGAPFASFKAAAERLLNIATYYQMKERAGRVGARGATAALRSIRNDFPALRIHLVGHSFGARLVTAAADVCGLQVRPASMLLLQAAFSHNAFAPPFVAEGREYTGFFRGVVADGKVAGPIIITHTANDRAVGLAYAFASRLARQVVARLGDENDLYGGLGRNGAVRMLESELGGRSLELLPPTQPYAFTAGRVFNLRADPFIDSHSGIRNEAVAHVLLSALG